MASHILPGQSLSCLYTEPVLSHKPELIAHFDQANAALASNQEKMGATYEDGILAITLPRKHPPTPPKPPKRIQIW